MPTLLTNLRFDKVELVSVVDKGASGDDENRPRIVLFKRRKPTKPKPYDVSRVAKEQTMPAGTPLPEGSQATLDAILGKLSDEEKAFIELLLAGAGAVAAPEAEAAPATEEVEASGHTDEDEDKQAEEEEEEEAKRGATAMAKLLKKSPELAEVLKTMSNRVGKAEDRAKKADKRAETAEAKTDKEVRKRRESEALKRAESIPYLPGDTKELAKMLVDHEDNLGKDRAAALWKRLEQANTLLQKSGAFEPQGSSGINAEGSAAAEVEKRAKELMAKDTSLTKAQARSKVYRADKDLKKRFRQEDREAHAN